MPAPRRPSAIHARWLTLLPDRCPSPAKTFEVAGEGRPEAFLHGLDAPTLPQKAMKTRMPCPEIGKDANPSSFRRADVRHLAPQLGALARAYRERRGLDTGPRLLRHRSGESTQLVEDGERRYLLHMVVWVQGPWKCSSYWPSTLRSSYSGRRNAASQLMKEVLALKTSAQLGCRRRVLPASQISSFLC